MFVDFPLLSWHTAHKYMLYIIENNIDEEFIFLKNDI